VGTVMAAAFALVWVAGGQLSAPVPRVIGDAPASLGAQPVQIASASGSTIHGWFSRGVTGRGAVLLLHGVRGDRRDMLPRAQFLHRAGFSVLLIDFQSHGESSQHRITFGYLESRDVSAALAFLTQKLPGEKLGVIGASLGAAAFVLAQPRPPVSAVVLESMYPTIDQAVADRLQIYLGRLGPLLAPLLEMQLKPRLGVSPEQLRPIDGMGLIHAPVFIIAGTLDQRTKPNETQAIFSAALPPKELWLLAGAAHVDLYAFAGEEYERRILHYFSSYLTRDDRAMPAR
jgi:uncharacterized protein